MRLAEKSLRKIEKMCPHVKIPKIAVIDFDKHALNANAIGGYHKDSDTLYINSRYNTKKKILDYINRSPGFFANTTVYAPYLHELGHKFYYDSIETLAKERGEDYNKVKKEIDEKISDYIKKHGGAAYAKVISGYAARGYSEEKITEVCAECFTIMNLPMKSVGEIMNMLKG